MKQAKYRVEAFIIPVCVDHNTNSTVSQTHYEKIELNEVNNMIVNTERKEENFIENCTNDLFTIEEESIQNLKNSITLKNITEASLIDITKENKNVSSNFYTSLQYCKTKYEASYNPNFCSNIFGKLNKLTPINEENELAEKNLTDLCYHGCKNGCSATVPTPQEVSEEVFRENWLQKLENIKQKEVELNNREIILQNREKALSEKEKEIKILECQLNDKLQQINLDLKKSKHMRDLLKISNMNKNNLEPLMNANFEVLQQEIQKKEFEIDNKLNPCSETLQTQDINQSQQDHLNKQLCNNIGNIYKDLQGKRSNGNSSSSSDHSGSDERKLKQHSNFKSTTTLKSSFGSKTVSNNFSKMKKHPKLHYEDLDTTLSADIGDSSFVQTSQKFNPELYRKPHAFTRSASERHGRNAGKGNSINLQVKNTGNIWEEFEAPTKVEQDKVLQRVTKNISVSQDKSTKYQNYGLIDYNVNTTNKEYKIENEKKYSYLNLETGNKPCSHQRLIRNTKERPISWNEETNEWLQKKRKAYTMTTKKVLIKDIEDKENYKCGVKNDRTEKAMKKNVIKHKILTIFR
ncbi:uncharacterized protein LOC116425153 [Nomia melanderi]|uniref:uncharacterized protein LOC116425153 n=1 Tax=Nomia melanderi TaxID=2448451 RepID=UPI0013042692|nr:uncharacterized protein PFB0765w-like [Nomia melanderi]XP_031828319.1 uncharacterized protein PFB0765w-like [Nomia melanderi]